MRGLISVQKLDLNDILAHSDLSIEKSSDHKTKLSDNGTVVKSTLFSFT